MKTLACSLLLCCCAVSLASGRDSAEARRERLIFCSQFVIEEPGSAIVLDSARDHDGFANRVYDCHLMDWRDTHS